MTITSLPRPALIAIVGAVAAVALFALSHRGSEPATSSSAPAASSPSAGPQTTSPPVGNPSTTPSTGSGTVTPPASTTKAPALSQPARSGGRSTNTSSSTKLPPPVKKALDAHKVVVLLFWNPAGTDDRSVKRAVTGLPRHHGHVAVFTDRLNRITRYTKITAATNLSQTPTLVVVNKRGQARVATGYLDRTSADQLVVDALHGP